MNSNSKLKHLILKAINMGQTVETKEFNALAHGVFTHQYAQNLPYRNYCDALKVTPTTVSGWEDIPALPTDAFKHTPTPLITFPESQISHTFKTSGTTLDISGLHHFPSSQLYDASILKAWDTLGASPVKHAIFLTPPAEQAPLSSLSHMMGTLAPHLSQTPHWIHPPTGKLDIPSIEHLLSTNTPIALLGTALSFLHWFESHPTKYTLPTGSWALETGGYKGSGRQLEKADLYAMFHSHLGLPATSIINEYSMTELSSQFYTRGLDQPHQAPPWTRIKVINPTTGEDASAGTPGYLCIYDLANLHSVLAIQTQDIAISHNDRSFTLLGRDSTALPRGCSRAADTAHQS